MEQMMEHLQAKVREFHENMNASQEWMIAKIDAWLEEMKAGQKETMAC
jgi:predicted transcriptional regulator